ncbi:UTP--glucose-1-phosphate uridylyltransferase [Candidatus Dojkabacteria bacterium]|nr:UTP--glucose-1-phosphate uridylyltransferase [Candidatus Dojkabacteria bacterium]
MAAKKVTKAIITAAGRGTRFLPASKAFQKEMVPIMHKPQLQWVIEEAIESGITDIAVVIRKGVDTFKDYFNDNKDLWKYLKKSKKEDLLDSWVSLKKEAQITLFYQKETDPYGNGTPFIIAKKFVKGEPFAAMWGDDIMVRTDKNKPTCLKQMINYYGMYEPTAVMSVSRVDRSVINKYASYEYLRPKEAKVPYQVKRLIEKPEPEEAPSLMANACRFILSYEVIEELGKKVKGKDEEIWLTDAVDRLVQQGKVVMAPPWQGSFWIPVGDPINWLKANLVISLIDKKYRKDAREIIQDVEKMRLIKT